MHVRAWVFSTLGQEEKDSTGAVELLGTDIDPMDSPPALDVSSSNIAAAAAADPGSIFS